MQGSTLDSIFYNGIQIPFSSFIQGPFDGSISQSMLAIIVDSGDETVPETVPPHKNAISIIAKRTSGSTYFDFGEYVSDPLNYKYWIGTCAAINIVTFKMTDFVSLSNENCLSYTVNINNGMMSILKTTVPQYYDFSPLFA